MSAAQDAAQRFRARVHVVELAPINASDALGVASAIAHAALGPDALATPGTELDRVAALGSSALRPLLLVLDNCEHLITEAAHAITYLLAKAPGISVLVTSRQPLGLSGEAIVLVEPLAIESEHGSSNSSPAVQLFLQRARTAAPNHPEFDLDLVSKICRRLDGLPLAIELAAARVGVLSLHDLDARLFDVLRSSRRNTSQTVDARRHATIDAAVRWSYELLADDERLVLNRASVFASSFDLQAATKVCGGTEFSEVDVMEIVSSLVDRSMISSVYAEVGNRFRLLEMVREFVASQVPVEEYESLKLTHQQHYLRTTAPLALALDAKPDASIIASLVADDLNVFAAIRHRSTPVALNAARKLALQLHTFFEETGRVPRAYVEMRDLLEPREPHSRLWRSLLGTTVVYSVMTGRTEEMTNELEVLRELVADRSDSTSRNTATWAYLGLAFFELTQANMSAAVDWFETAGSVIGQFDTNGQRQWLMTCGACMAYDGRAVDALHFYDEARKLPGVPQGWFDDYADVFVRAAQVQRDPRQASDHIDSMIRSLTALSDLHLGFRTTVATLHACFALEEADRAEQLEVWWRVALDAAYRNGHLWGVGMALQLGAWSAARQHDDEIAATRFAVTDAAFVRSGFRLPKAFVAISNTYLAALQQRMGPAFAEVSTAARSFDPAAYAAQTNSHPR